MLLHRLDTDEDGSTERIFRRWTLSRPRDPEEGLDGNAEFSDHSVTEVEVAAVGNARLPILE